MEADGAEPELDRDALVKQIIYVSKYSNPFHFPSMHQDMPTNRPTEVDYINGAIVRTAEKHGMKIPYHAMLVDLIHLKEASRQYEQVVSEVQA